MTPTTIEELFDTPDSEIDYSGDIYAINKALSLPPWSPPVVEVWLNRKRKPPTGETGAETEWPRVRALLLELKAEHDRRGGA